MGSSLRLVTEKVGPVTVAGGAAPPVVGGAEIRVTTEPFSLDHLKVAVPSGPGWWISTR